MTPTASSIYRHLFHGFLIALLVTICYSNSLHTEFHFDDFPNIVKDPNIHLEKLSWQDILRAKRHSQNKHILISRPLARISFALNYYFSRLNTTGYHITNLAIHVLAAIFLYSLFVLFLGTIHTRETEALFADDCCDRADLALLAASLWAIHPINVQAVTYIVQRMASMGAMFYILSFALYLTARTSSKKPAAALYYSSSFLAWIMAVLTKENTVMLPCSIILYETIFFPITKRKKILFIVLAGLFAITACTAFIFMRGNIAEYLEKMYSSRPFSMIQRIMTEPRILVYYLGLILLPVGQILKLESDIIPSTGFLSPPSTIISILFLLFLIAGSLFLRKKFPLLSFSILFYFLNHLVESSFIGLELYFEHRNYLPSVFLFLSISLGFLSIFKHFRIQGNRRMSSILSGFLVLFLVGSGSATWLRNEDWQTAERLQRDAIDKAPENIRPYITLAAILTNKGNRKEALEYLKKADALVKKYPHRYQKNHIGLLYYNAAGNHLKQKNYEKAEKLYRKSLFYRPDYWESYVALGYVYFQMNRMQDAQSYFEAGLRLNRQNPRIYNMLAMIYAHQGKDGEAEMALRKGLETKDVPILALNLTGILMDKGKTDQAKKVFYGIEREDNDPIYLLYECILTDQEKIRNKEAIKLGKLLAQRKVNICQWIEKAEKNASLGVFYPDISSIRDRIISGYDREIEKIAQEVTAYQYKNCPGSPAN